MYLITEWLHKNTPEDEGQALSEAKNQSLIQANGAVQVETATDFNHRNLKLQIPEDPVEYVAFSDKGKVAKKAITYTSDTNLLRHNHPLMIMVINELALFYRLLKIKVKLFA